MKRADLLQVQRLQLSEQTPALLVAQLRPPAQNVPLVEGVQPAGGAGVDYGKGAQPAGYAAVGNPPAAQWSTEQAAGGPPAAGAPPMRQPFGYSAASDAAGDSLAGALADGLASSDADGSTDALSAGDSLTTAVGVGADLGNSPLARPLDPNSSAYTKIATNTPTTAMTNTADARSST